ncbi:MAG: hypothetical protein A2Y10_06020 [Planctomycetes bacterium GWF2_41_51]|nr:MAG: hypothetical protein A2Y10_06020 [Planctomycetes bacterium GWF2_41_51]
MKSISQNKKILKQKRPLVSLGIFSPRHWSSFKPNDKNQISIYKALRQAGFKETIWQFIYRGQIGGLVLPLNDGRAELHVRFYTNTIEAELEVGRKFIGHFLQPRFQAESIVLSKIKKYLSQEDFETATTMFREDRSQPVFHDFSSNFDCSFIFIAVSISLLSLILVIFNIISIFISAIASLFVILLYKTLPGKNTINQPIQ